MAAKLHHSALCMGYIPVRNDGFKEAYCGRYGVGYIVHHANLRASINGKRSNKYHVIDYYIYENG